MSSHQSTHLSRDEWLTPPRLLKLLGRFDLDPCAPKTRPWPTARKYFTRAENGLRQVWRGRVWCNPPYGSETILWLKKMAWHGNGIALVFARTETEAFFRWVWPYASAVFFFKGRLHFHNRKGKRAPNNAGAPSVLIAYGKTNARVLAKLPMEGKFIQLKR